MNEVPLIGVCLTARIPTARKAGFNRNAALRSGFVSLTPIHTKCQ
jgi:hypothetical protein